MKRSCYLHTWVKCLSGKQSWTSTNHISYCSHTEIKYKYGNNMWLLRFSGVGAVLYVTIKISERLMCGMTALPPLVGNGWETVVLEGCFLAGPGECRNTVVFCRRTQEHQLSQESRSMTLTLRKRLHLKAFTQGFRKIRATYLFGLEDQEMNVSYELEDWGCGFGSLQVAYLL